MSKIEIDYKFERNLESDISVPYFYEKIFLGYVEGEDDIGYWSKKLKEYEINDIFLKEIKGKDNISKKIDEILHNEKLVFIFLDKDYNEILGRLSNNDKIIYTYGHSIENSFCCEKKLFDMIVDCNNLQSFNKIELENLKNEMEKFFSKAEKEMKELLIFDILNEKKAGEENYQAFGFLPQKSYEEFFTKEFKWKKNAKNSKEKILKLAEESFSQSEINDVKDKIDENDWKKYIRGHLLNSIFLLFFKKNTREVVSLGYFNKFLIEKCSSCREKCIKKDYYSEKMYKIKEIIEKNKVIN